MVGKDTDIVQYFGPKKRINSDFDQIFIIYSFTNILKNLLITSSYLKFLIHILVISYSPSEALNICTLIIKFLVLAKPLNF